MRAMYQVRPQKYTLSPEIRDAGGIGFELSQGSFADASDSSRGFLLSEENWIRVHARWGSVWEKLTAGS